MRPAQSLRIFPAVILALVSVVTTASDETVAAQGVTFTVNSKGDVGDYIPGDGVCDDNAGGCTLRAAIEEANASAGIATIAFSFAGPGPHTIQPATGLPTITDPVIIDGYTQPGTTPNTNGPGLGLNTVLQIELDGSLLGLQHALGISAGGSTVRGLVINGFGATAVRLTSGGGNTVEGNFIGTDVTGAVDRGNGWYGVTIANTANNTIGGVTARARNLISGNGKSGVQISGATAIDNLVQGNLVGVDVSGAAALGNSEEGVSLSGSGNTIGRTEHGAGNVLSGNSLRGVFIAGGTANLIQGNFIGLDVTGTAALGNGGDGFYVSGASGNTIGGVEAGARNVISGNTRFGVYLTNGSTGNLIQGNFIGTDGAGSTSLGNAVGIEVGSNAPGNTIGGVSAGAGNVVSGNAGNGINLRGSSVAQNLVQGNLVGTDALGTAALGNGGSGVAIAGGANDTTIGGTTAGAGNTIAHNGGDGVFVASGAGHRIASNSIFSNGGLGIDLGSGGVTPNDALDQDSGANNLQNSPVLTTGNILFAGGKLEVEYFADSAVENSTYPLRVEFFIADDDGEEGKTFLGSHTYTAVEAQTPAIADLGNAAAIGVAAADLIVATATDSDGNTSEFSRALAVVVQPPPPTPIPGTTALGLVVLAGLTVAFMAWRLGRGIQLGPRDSSTV